MSLFQSSMGVVQLLWACAVAQGLRAPLAPVFYAEGPWMLVAMPYGFPGLLDPHTWVTEGQGPLFPVLCTPSSDR